MGSYKIEWKRSASKELKKLSGDTILRILEVVDQLSQNPYPAGVRKLVGSEYSYRIRVGDYRVIYSIVESSLFIEIIRVRHRKDVYKR